MTSTLETEAEDVWPGAPEDEPLWAAAVVTANGVVVTAGPFGDHYSATSFATEAANAGLRAQACPLQSPPEVRRFLNLPPLGEPR